MDRTEQLVDMVKRMVEIIKYDNQYAYKLLRKVTLRKHVIIEIDGCRIFLKAQNINGYYLTAIEIGIGKKVQFRCSSFTLRKIMSGVMNINQAIVKNELFISAQFKELLRIFNLTVTLLTEGSLNTRLRDLWQEFNDGWNNDIFPLSLQPLENQKVEYNYLIKQIPLEVFGTKSLSKK